MTRASDADAYSPDGRLRILDTGEMYDEQTRQVRQTLKLQEAMGDPKDRDDGAFSPDGSLFAAPLRAARDTQDRYRGIQVWESATGKPMALIPEKARGYPTFAPDGRTVVVIDDDEIRAWDAVTGEKLYRQPVGERLLSS